MSTRPQKWLETAATHVESRASQHAWALTAWRTISAAVENFIDNNDLLRASALTYTVALSIVPMLALAFSALKGLGEENRLRPMVDKYLAMGSSGVADQLMQYVANVNAAALGTAGAAFLLITVVSTLGNIEQAFNDIFRVPRSRGYLRKFSDYLSVVFTVPLLMAAALAVTAVFSVRAAAIPILPQLLPYAFVWAGFFFLFVFFPFTKVDYRAAAYGSLVTAILFQFAQWGYVRFQIGVANYRAIYGAFATVPIFLVWIYIAWAVILFGAEVTAATQRGVDRVALKAESPDFACTAALRVLIKLADLQVSGAAAFTRIDLAHEIGVAPAALDPILESLKDGGYIVEAVSDSGGKAGPPIHLVRAPDAIKLADVLAPILADPQSATDTSRIGPLIRQIATARMKVLEGLTLADVSRRPVAGAQTHTTDADKPARTS